MHITSRASKCSSCNSIKIPPSKHCSCWSPALNNPLEDKDQRKMLYGVILHTGDQSDFFSISEIGKLLREGKIIYGTDGMRIWENYF